MSYDVGEALLILQPFRHFTYVTAHSPTLPSLYLRHRSFSNPSVASLTSQLILQPFFRFSYVTGSSLMSPGEPPIPYRCFYMTHASRVLHKHDLSEKGIVFGSHIVHIFLTTQGHRGTPRMRGPTT